MEMKWSNRSQESIDNVDKVPFFFSSGNLSTQ